MGVPSDVPTGEFSEMDLLTVVVANVGGKFGVSSSMTVTEVVDGLPKNT